MTFLLNAMRSDMTAIPVYDEQQLLLQVASGDEDAFATLYHQYHDMVQRYVLKFLKSQDLSDDIVQEVFIKIWESRCKLSAVRCVKAYLLIISRNHTLNFLKRMAQDQDATTELIKHYQEFRNTAEEKLLSKEYQQCLQQVLQALPLQTRKVFDLCRQQQKNYEETAVLLGISPHAVKKHIVRANKIFKSSFKNLLDISVKSLLLFLLFK